MVTIVSASWGDEVNAVVFGNAGPELLAERGRMAAIRRVLDAKTEIPTGCLLPSR